MGNTGVFQGYPYPYPSLSVPATKGMGISISIPMHGGMGIRNGVPVSQVIYYLLVIVPTFLDTKNKKAFTTVPFRLIRPGV